MRLELEGSNIYVHVYENVQSKSHPNTMYPRLFVVVSKYVYMCLHAMCIQYTICVYNKCVHWDTTMFVSSQPSSIHTKAIHPFVVEFQLFDMRKLSLGNGDRALLLTCLRKGIERIQGTTDILHY